MLALKAPLKFPASLHDKVISMRHLDTDKTNDPNYLEKAKFWNSQLISIARQLHVQLMSDPDLRGAGKLLSVVGTGLWEREMVELPEPEVADPASAEAMAKKAPWGRGGVPFPKKLHGSPTRVVAAQEAVDKRFGNWAEFLSFAPLDELFSLERESGEGPRLSNLEAKLSERPLAQTARDPADCSVVKRVPVDLNQTHPVVAPRVKVQDADALRDLLGQETTRSVSTSGTWARQPRAPWIEQMVRELCPEKRELLRYRLRRVQAEVATSKEKLP
ncbi:unnamed protein product [Effrenium voratum]|nr:unnamed protein product [Effrenium voratum]